MNVPRVGLGYDVHPVAGEGPLVLGGVELDGPGLGGHSDADVVAHAVADAVLGASDLPDLGTLFPADDDRYAGASSIELLEDVARRVVENGWRVGNVDVVVAAERPRLGPHVTAMREHLTRALAPAVLDGTDGPLVTVRAKFGEGVGAVGRGEAIAAWAVALVTRS